jgi:dTDP-4-amino-4,6-dideoxygalactose transaminase
MTVSRCRLIELPRVEDKRGRSWRRGCFSSCPVKNSGVYGDGGTVTTTDRSPAEGVKELRPI